MHFARKGPACAEIERRGKNQQTKTLDPGLCPRTMFLLFMEFHLNPPVWVGPKSNLRAKGPIGTETMSHLSLQNSGSYHEDIFNDKVLLRAPPTDNYAFNFVGLRKSTKKTTLHLLPL